MDQKFASQNKLTEKEWRLRDRARMRQEMVESVNSSGIRIGEICGLYGVSRSTFWRWRLRYQKHGLKGLLLEHRTCRPRKIKPEIEQKILELREKLGYGHQRISLYLKRYLGIKVAASTVWTILKRNKMPNLYMTRYNKPAMCSMKRYEKAFPGETVQMDVKFIKAPDKSRRRYYQFTAIDDCTRFRVLRIYSQHTTSNALDFLERVKENFPVAIRQVQTDNGAEFATEFTFALDQQGIHHRRIRPRTPRLNGKVERSHRTDEQEFYSKHQFQDLEDMKKKLLAWEKHYNLERGHMALNGETPVERLKTKLSTKLQGDNVAR
jgi:transposase InsO family protein